MLFIFPIGPHLEEKTLEGMSIIVCIRWMVFATLCVFLSVLIYLGLKEQSPRHAYDFSNHYLIPFLACSYLTLIARDVWLVRRRAIAWDDYRIHSQTVMKRLPLLLVVLVPLFLLTEGLDQSLKAIEWAVDMLWVFSVFSMFFYAVYLVLLLSLLKLPKLPAILGVALAVANSIWGYQNIKERDDDEGSKSQQTESFQAYPLSQFS